MKTSLVVRRRSVMIPRRMRQGMGVRCLMLMRAILRGKCPLRAPTKNNRDEANIPLLTAPKVEQATKKGMIHRITPNILLPKVTATALEERISVEDRTAK